MKRSVRPKANSLLSMIVIMLSSIIGILLVNQDAAILSAHKTRLAFYEQFYGPDSPHTLHDLDALANLHSAEGRFAEEHRLLLRAVRIEEGSFNRNLEMSQLLDRLSRVARSLNRPLEAASYSQQASQKRLLHDDVQRQFRDSRIHRTLGSVSVGSSDPNIVNLTFQTAQIALKSAAGDGLREGVRKAKLRENPKLEEALTEEKKLNDELQALAREPQTNEPNAAKQADEIQGKLDALMRGRSLREQVRYTQLESAIYSIEKVQKILGDNEILVLLLEPQARSGEPDHALFWAITTTTSRWGRLAISTSRLKDLAAALRCGLDLASWIGEGETRCQQFLTTDHTLNDFRQGTLLPFSHAHAHEAFAALFGSFEDLLATKTHLLLIPPVSLAQLPFHILVTAPPSSDDNRTAAWFARSHAISVLPAVSSLAALRTLARPSDATLPLVGFGNPLLSGRRDDHDQALAAARHPGCGIADVAARQSNGPLRRSPSSISLLGDLADIQHIKRQPPLPDTADELCEVARQLNADVHEIRLGSRATEREVKALSASGQLAQFRVVHFATHGVLAGQLGVAEPGLILTPPETASQDDDGYLSASEIARLRLDAEWVILSACNTAGAAGANPEALSGLARAFFEAHARTLLVSHWEVNSHATVTLITSTVSAISADKSIGRAEALRRAMLSMIGSDKHYEAHPAYWAPFVTVGEGAQAMSAK